MMHFQDVLLSLSHCGGASYPGGGPPPLPRREKEDSSPNNHLDTFSGDGWAPLSLPCETRRPDDRAAASPPSLSLYSLGVFITISLSLFRLAENNFKVPPPRRLDN